MTLTMNLQNLQQKNFILSTIKIMDNMVEEMIQPLNVKQKSLNHIFVITHMHMFL